MENNDSKQITITIAGRPYQLKIAASKEASIRKIAKEVNEKVNKFQLNYPSRDKQDCLAMVLLGYAVDLFKSQQNTQETSEYTLLSEKLSTLDSMLEALLIN